MDHSTASESFDGAHTVLQRAAELAMEYLRDLPDRHVDAITGYDEVLNLLSGPVPEHGTDAVAVIQRLAAILGPATIASAGPRCAGC
jgi:hypothetical protein